MNIDEKELLQALRGKLSREAAFERLVRATQQRLYAHLRRMLHAHPDADDALQNTYLKAWRAIDNFRGDSALYSWLYRIASNEALALIEHRKRHRVPMEVLQPGATAHLSGPDGDEIQLKLEKALQLLPPKQRLVFDLRYFEEMPYEQIAHITGTSIGALKASYFHAVKKLEAGLSNH